MNKKIFAFDIDGTLFRDDNKIHPETIETIIEAKQKGHVIILSSGRGKVDLMDPLKQLGRENVDYLVCNNGAYVINVKSDDYIMPNKLPDNILDEIVRVGKKYKSLFALCTVNHVKRTYLANSKDELSEWSINKINNGWSPFTIIDGYQEVLELAKLEPITMIELLVDPKLMPTIKSELNFEGKVDIHISHNEFYDVSALNTSKYNGIKVVSKLESISDENIISFGDSGNDLDMIAKSKYGYAMGNSEESIKKVAYEVIGDNNSNAIAIAMTKHI